MFVPRLQQRKVKKAALRGAAEALGYSVLRSEQAVAFKKFVTGHDVFVSLPTDSGNRAYVLPACLWFMITQCACLN